MNFLTVKVNNHVAGTALLVDEPDGIAAIAIALETHLRMLAATGRPAYSFTDTEGQDHVAKAEVPFSITDKDWRQRQWQILESVL